MNIGVLVGLDFLRSAAALRSRASRITHFPELVGGVFTFLRWPYLANARPMSSRIAAAPGWFIFAPIFGRCQAPRPAQWQRPGERKHPRPPSVSASQTSTLRNVRLMRTAPANGCSPSASASTPW
jgi:hypothetical protein